MKFTDSVWINAASHKVWEYVGSLETWPRYCFYAKTGTCVQISPEGGVVGSLYQMETGSGSRIRSTHCEIVDLRPGSMIAVKLTVTGGRMQGEALQVSYELKDEGFRTKVTERVVMTDHSDFRITLNSKVIGWLIGRFCRLAGVTNLQRLKGIVEGTL